MMRVLQKRTVFAATLLASAVTFLQPSTAQEALTVAVYGGEWGEGITQCILQPFTAATGITVTPDPGTSTVTLAKLRQQKGNPAIDVAWIDGGVSELAGEEGVVATLDPAKIPNMANMETEGVYKSKDGKVYGLSTGFYSLGLVYNTEDVKPAPTSWWDLSKPEFDGASTVPSPANAMGVPLFVHINKLAGGDLDNFKPAIDKYKEWKVSSYFDSSGAATNSFQSGEVIVGGHYASAAWSLADKGLPISYSPPKEGAPSGDIRVHIVEGTKKTEAAEKLVDFAIGKEQAKCLSEKLYVGPATKGVELSDKAKSRMPWGDGTIADLARIDWPAINAKRQAITDIWNKEIARK